MPLTIHLHNHAKHYSGTETITGTVKFTSSTPTPLQDIRITLSGRSKTKISKVKGVGGPSATYKSKCILFEKEKILTSLQNGESLPPGEYEWDLEFVMPPTAQSNVKWPKETEKKKTVYRSDAGHPLPPTFATETKDESRKVLCAIDYKLEAKVLKPSGGIFASRSPLFAEEVRLNFLPEYAISSIQEAQDEGEIYRQEKNQLFNIRSGLLLPENRGRSLRVGEKIQALFAPGQLPKFSFTATLSYPTRVIQGSPIGCLLDITPHMEDSSVTSTPEIVMNSVSVNAISQTAARAAPSLMGSISAELDEKIEILNKSSLRMPVSGRAELGKDFGPLVLRHTGVSFRTFNIARTYRLNVVIGFECAGKTNEFKVSDLPFEVVADVQRALGKKKGLDFGFGGGHGGENGTLAEMGVDEAPPVYSPAVSSTRSTRAFEEV